MLSDIRPGQSAVLPAGRLTIEIFPLAGTATSGALAVTSPGGESPPGVHVVGALRATVIGPPRALDVSIVSEGESFSEGDVFAGHVSVHIEGEEHQVNLPDRDVAGVQSSAILTLRPDQADGTSWRVTATASPLAARRLPGAAHAAMVAARRMVHAEELRESQRADLHLVLDTSASMQRADLDGNVRDLVSALTGLAYVVGTQPLLRVWRASPDAEGLGQIGAEQLPEWASSIFDGTRWHAGAVVSPALRAIGAARSRRVTYVMTDGLPDDTEELLTLLDGAGGDGRSNGTGGTAALDHVHLVVLGRSGPDVPAQEPWRDDIPELAQLRRSTTAGRGLTSLQLTARGAVPAILADQITADRLVGSLLSWCLPSTPLHAATTYEVRA